MKNILFKTMILLAFIFMMHGKANSQTNVKIMDLAIIPLISMDTTIQDSIELKVQFKINKPAEAAKVHFLLGTARDSSDILIISPPVFITNGGTTLLTYKGQSDEVKNYQAVFIVKINKADYSDLLKATLFVETNSGQYTTRLYF
jgi:hypothetical protein